MEAKHFWQFEVFDPKSQWLFVPVSDFARSLGLYVRELGHFYQDGYCYTRRVPEDSFALIFGPGSAGKERFSRVEFPDHTETLQIEQGWGVTLYDNRKGYTVEQNGPSESYFIQFGGAQAEVYYRMFTAGNGSSRRLISRENELVELYEDLVNVYRQPANEVRDLYANMRLTQVLTHLVQEAHEGTPVYVRSEYVEKTLAIIEERYQEDLRLSRVAEELHLNSSYLSRLISRETGSSFSACVAHVRINRAKELLYTSQASVDEIAFLCGFCNASHFIRVFRKSEGFTPCQFRSQRKGKMS